MLKMNARIEAVWHAIKDYLPPGTRVTSAYRSPQDQLAIIVELATRAGYRFRDRPRLDDEETWAAAYQFIRLHLPHLDVARPLRSQHERGRAIDLAGPDLQAIKAGVLKAKEAHAIVLLHRSGWENPRVEKNGCVHVEFEAAFLDHEPIDFA
jgi:hypothetical protein